MTPDYCTLWAVEYRTHEGVRALGYYATEAEALSYAVGKILCSPVSPEVYSWESAKCIMRMTDDQLLRAQSSLH